MWNRMRNIWLTENFHYAHRPARGGGQFERGYIKLVDASGQQPCAHVEQDRVLDA